jgi:hypothetical protein
MARRGQARSEEPQAPKGHTLAEFAGAPDVGEEEPGRAPSAATGREAVEDGKRAVEAPLDEATMGRGFERIVERVFSIDVAAEYDRLEAALKFDGPAHQKSYAELVDALDEATDNALRASRLVASGKAALETFEIDCSLVLGDMRGQANHALQDEKAKGFRNKAITDADVESWMATKFADEYRAHTERRAKAKRMVDVLERLADLWKTRTGTLDTMVKGARRL